MRALLIALLPHAAVALCTGAARENIKACRRPKEPYEPAEVPPPEYPASLDSMADLELVLVQFGLKGLQRLNVTFRDDGGREVPLRGAGSRMDNGKQRWLGVQPSIRWECFNDV